MREPVTFYDAPNPRLWVRLAPGSKPDRELRWLISGAAHTARGRFHVCSEAGDLSVDIRDVVETSPEAAIWLDGFLHGQTPNLWEFMGEDYDLWNYSDEDDWRRHHEWNRRFLQTGRAPSLAVLPKRDARLTGLGTPLPWCYVATCTGSGPATTGRPPTRSRKDTTGPAGTDPAVTARPSTTTMKSMTRTSISNTVDAATRWVSVELRFDR